MFAIYRPQLWFIFQVWSSPGSQQESNISLGLISFESKQSLQFQLGLIIPSWSSPGLRRYPVIPGLRFLCLISNVSIPRAWVLERYLKEKEMKIGFDISIISLLAVSSQYSQDGQDGTLLMLSPLYISLLCLDNIHTGLGDRGGTLLMPGDTGQMFRVPPPATSLMCHSCTMETRILTYWGLCLCSVCAGQIISRVSPRQLNHSSSVFMAGVSSQGQAKQTPCFYCAWLDHQGHQYWPFPIHCGLRVHCLTVIECQLNFCFSKNSLAIISISILIWSEYVAALCLTISCCWIHWESRRDDDSSHSDWDIRSSLSLIPDNILCSTM